MIRQYSGLNYYVYQLIDPRNERPFYVGKGKGPRVREHEHEARTGGIGEKCDRIREIWAQGFEVKREIIAEFDSEERAFAREMQIIKRIGLKNLTNKTRGGGGSRTRKCRGTLTELRAEAATFAMVMRKLSLGWTWLGEQNIRHILEWMIGEAICEYGPENFVKVMKKHGISVTIDNQTGCDLAEGHARPIL